MTRPTYIFAGGGTGGHILPGLAVAQELRRRQPEAIVVFACSRRMIDRKLLEGRDFPFVPQPLVPLPKRPWRWPGFLWTWRRSIRLARDLVRDLRPRAVLGLGGFAAGAVVKVAARRGVPTALLNPDAVPGRANRYLARRVDAIFTQFPSTAECFPVGIRNKVRTTGCPVRSELLSGRRDEALKHFGLSGQRKTLLVFGGSTLAESLTDAVLALAGDLATLAEGWQLLLPVGPDRLDETKASLQSRSIPACVLPYCDRMDLAYAAADLALCRGGAVTIAELSATGTPAVILPYPHHKDRQQYLNAAALVEAGAARLVEDRCDAAATAEGLREELLPILRDAQRLQTMRSCAKTSSNSSAAGDIADWLIEQV